MKRKFGLYFTAGLLFSSVVPFLTSCGEKDFMAETHLDLAKSVWAGSNFAETGYGVVTLRKSIDGDTAHFYTTTHELISGRFEGVDTPESTGVKEPWGKAASNYTKDLLTNAKTILLETDRGATKGAPAKGPQADSNGSRYMVWVWVSDRTLAEEDGSGFRLVNLGLVQNGYSGVKGIDDCYYKDVLIDADAQAQDLKLVIWSNKQDPDHNYGDAETFTLKKITQNLEEYVGGRYKFEAIVVRKIGSDAYLESYETDSEGKLIARYGIYMFTQYNHNADKYLKVGRKLTVVGELAEHNGSYQVVDINFPLLSSQKGDKYTTFADGLKHKIYDPTVLTATEFVTPASGDDFENHNSFVRLENIKITGGYGGLDEKDHFGNQNKKNSMTLYGQDANGDEVTIRIDDRVAIDNGSGGTIESFSDFVGHTYTFDGFKGKYARMNFKTGEETIITQLMIADPDDVHLVK